MSDMLRQRCVRCGHPRGGHYSETARNCLHRDARNFGTCPCPLFTLVEETWVATLGGAWTGETRTVIVRQHVPDGGFWTGTTTIFGAGPQSYGKTALLARDAVFSPSVAVEWKLVEKPPKKLTRRMQIRAVLEACEAYLQSPGMTPMLESDVEFALLDEVRAALGKAP